MHKIKGFVLACTEVHENGKQCNGAMEILKEDGTRGLLVMPEYKQAMKEAVEHGTFKIKRVEVVIFDDEDEKLNRVVTGGNTF